MSTSRQARQPCAALGLPAVARPRPVLLCGTGELGRAVLGALLAAGPLDVRLRDARGEDAAALGDAIAGMHAVVSCADGPDALGPALAAACRAAGVPLLTVRLDGAEGRVVLSGGCALCADRHRAARDPSVWVPDAHRRRPGARPPRWPHPWSGAALASLARLAALAAWEALDAGEVDQRDRRRVVAVDADTGETRRLPLSSHPACPACFPSRPGDRRALRRAVERRWHESLRRDPGPPPELAALRARLEAVVGREYGLFEPPRRLTPGERAAVARFFASRGVDPADHALARAHSALVARPLVSRGRATAVVTGALDFDDPAAAEALALVEGLERLVALDMGDPARVVRARHRTVRDEALDPRGTPLYAEAQFRQPGFPLRPFDPEQVVPWVWGMRLPDHTPVLVPRDLVLAPGRRPAIFRPTSSGAACHSGFHHAVLNGICEVVERDALMVTWLDRLSLPRVRPGPADPDPFGLRRTLGALGMDCALVDLTTDLGVPVLLAVLTDRLDPDFFLVDMVAALDPRTQLGKLSREVAQFLHPHLVAPGFFQGAATRSRDPDAVEDLPDHPAFYQHRDKIPLADFLAASTEARPLGHGPYAPGAATAAAQVEVLVDRLAGRGHEVIVVDCTVPLLERLGLHAVRVLVPGLVPLTAGHRLRALGGRRALELPRRLRLADRDLTLEELNPWPHPFW